MKIKKVTKTGFTTEDGRVFQHPVELDNLIPLNEFQRIYDYWDTVIRNGMSTLAGEASRGTADKHQGSQQPARNQHQQS